MKKRFQLFILCMAVTLHILNTRAAEPDTPPVPDPPLENETGTEISHTGVLVEFDLLDRAGRRVTQNAFSGKYVLLTFGYTHCEHICPMIVSSMARTLKANDNNSVGVFISVDTERDTPALTDDYAAGFSKNITGLSGSYTDVSTAANNFMVSYSVTKTQKHYVVQHSTDIFLIGPDGRLLGIYTFNSLPQRIE